jgi:hypothetical protein
MEAGKNSVIYMGLISGPNKADDTCGPTTVTGTMDRGFTVFEIMSQPPVSKLWFLLGMAMLPGSLPDAVANELLFCFMISDHTTTTPVYKYIPSIALSVCLYVKWEYW